MKIIKKVLPILLMSVVIITMFTGCDEESGTTKDRQKTLSLASSLQTNQPTPTDIEYSLERYNLVKRAYWVNGQREKAMSLPCAVDRPLGYVVLLADSGAVLGTFVVDGKVSSLNSYLAEAYYYRNGYSYEMADVDGSYGQNDGGIFFFTTDSKYIEWTGTYLYSDIPFTVDEPVLKVGE